MRIYLLFTFALTSFIFTSCKDDSAIPVAADETQTRREILNSFTYNTVIPTYKNMSDNAILFLEACKLSEDGFTDAEVENAANIWKSTRQYWEKSEAFLFGPADYNNLDPLLDSWPLDKNQLDQLLAQPDISTIDARYVRNNFGASLRGFHAIEYILFRDGQPRKANEITDKEKAYLLAVSEVLRDDCITLEAWWAGTASLTEQKRDMLSAAGILVGQTFGFEIVNAGNSGSRYSSQAQAIYQIVQGCIDIADEVGNSKIADPAQSGNVLDVESWYSWNSLTDFKNNIQSIKNVYLGGIENNRAASLSALISQKDQNLDVEIKSNIETSISKIGEIGEPFRNNLNNKVKINEAIAACNSLMKSLSKINNIIK
jgi:Imelysin.